MTDFTYKTGVVATGPIWLEDLRLGLVVFTWAAVVLFLIPLIKQSSQSFVDCEVTATNGDGPQREPNVHCTRDSP